MNRNLHDGYTARRRGNDRSDYWDFYFEGTLVGSAFRRVKRLGQAGGWYTGYSSRDFVAYTMPEAARRLHQIKEQSANPS